MEQEHSRHKMGHGYNNHAPVGTSGHNHAKMIDDYKRRFWISLAFTLPILLLFGASG